ncbi:MAG: hypothetical protein ABUK01_01260 [Leptospirales bacterium]
MNQRKIISSILIAFLISFGYYSYGKSKAIGKVIAYPNPFHPGKHTLTIKPANSATFSGTVRFKVYDFNENLAYSGSSVTNSVIKWSGHNNSGTRVSPGLYFIQLTQTYPDSSIGVKYVKVLVQ